MDFIRRLSSDPFQHGDYADTDPAGHPTLVKLIDRYAVTFFVDHAAREVKVLNIQPADEA